MKKMTSALTLFFFFCIPAVQASPITFVSSLGPEADGATGTGMVTLVYDGNVHTLSIDAQWSGLSGATTVAHIHCCTPAPESGAAGVAVTPGTLPGFPPGVTSGTYQIVLDLADQSNYTAGFLSNFGGGTVAGAEAALFSGLSNRLAYFNVHSNEFPGGEIRGFPQAVPEPLSLILFGMGLLAIPFARRSRFIR